VNASKCVVLATMVLSGCIASNVVDPGLRLLATGTESLAFVPAPEFAWAGLYMSVEVQGEAAASLRRIWYWFRADGTYTAAALIETDVVAFQTRDGTWRHAGGQLHLDDGPPVAVEVVGEFVRLTSGAGRVVLRHEALQ